MRVVALLGLHLNMLSSAAQPANISSFCELVYECGPQSGNLGQIVTSKGMTYAAGPSFQWNILNYGQITNDVRLQDAMLQQLLVDYQNTVLKAQQQVDDGISTFQQSLVQVGYLRKSAEAARGALRIGTEQYEQGATDFTTVLTAEQNLFQAESNVATALANVGLGATAIYRALGGGWQIREDSYFVTAATRDQMRARTNLGGTAAAARPAATAGSGSSFSWRYWTHRSASGMVSPRRRHLRPRKAGLLMLLNSSHAKA